MSLPRPPRRHPRRDGVGVHRAPRRAPDSPSEVLAAAADVSRETSEKDAESAAWGRLAAAPEVQLVAPAAPVDPPPLRKEQILRLEALTAKWARDVRIGGPGPDDTLLSAAPRPPVPPRREDSPPVPVEADVAERTAELRLPPRPPAPAPAPVPGAGSGPALRVSDWVSRHDPRSLEYAAVTRLDRPVPLQDVSLEAGPVLDQGTVPPLTVKDASACVGMACAAAANVLTVRQHGDIGTGYAMHREEDARGLYHAAQKLDHVHGEDYAGTSVLGGMKAGRAAGWWDTYLWALRGTRDIAQVLLQLRLAVVLGLPWSERLENPDSNGVIAPGGANLGGHSLAAVGLRLVLGGRPGPWFELQQSRGPAEGVGGRVFIHHRDLGQLLAGIGEAAVPLPREAS